MVFPILYGIWGSFYHAVRTLHVATSLLRTYWHIEREIVEGMKEKSLPAHEKMKS